MILLFLVSLFVAQSLAQGYGENSKNDEIQGYSHVNENKGIEPSATIQRSVEIANQHYQQTVPSDEQNHQSSRVQDYSQYKDESSQNSDDTSSGTGYYKEIDFNTDEQSPQQGGEQYKNHEPQIDEITKVIPVYKTLSVPFTHKVQKTFKIPVPVKVLEPYPLQVHVPVRVEKVVHVPVEKIVKYPVEKLVPYQVTKEVPYPVTKPYPVLVPYYKLKIVLHAGKDPMETYGYKD